jgi:hypothetical protein
MLIRTLVLTGAALLAGMQGSDGWARSAHGFAHGGGGSVEHAGGHFAAPVAFAPRRVFFAAPVAYYAPAYYPPPPAYYPATQPLAYYETPLQPPVYYAPPMQSAPPAARYEPPAAYAPSQAPIYFCRDANGRTSVTNRREDTAGKNCSLQDQAASPPPQRAKGPYAAQDALRYRFFCPDTRKYYPEINTCASAWLKVVPDSAAAR